jgi:hypothetical protein
VKQSQAEYSEELNADDRAGCLLVLLDRATSAVELLQLVEVLGLADELEQLAGAAEQHPERHRRIEAARAALELKLSSLPSIHGH